MKNKVYNYLIENFCFDDFYLKDVSIEQQNGLFKTVSKYYDLIIFNSKRIVFFAQLKDNIGNTDAIVLLRSSLNFLTNKLSRSLNDFLVCGINNINMYMYNNYNDRLHVFNLNDDDSFEIVKYIENELSYGSNIFDYSIIRNLIDTLTFSIETKHVSKTTEKVKVDAKGISYINKHGRWQKASDFNTEQVFLLSVFMGMFGGHLFFMKKRGKAFLYFITFGLFGVGWIFDNIEILFNIYKDPEGKYLIPLENKMVSFFMLLIGFVIFCFLGTFVMFLLNFIAKNSSEIINSLLSGFME